MGDGAGDDDAAAGHAGEDQALGELAAPLCKRVAGKSRGEKARPLNPLADADAQLLEFYGSVIGFAHGEVLRHIRRYRLFGYYAVHGDVH